MSGHLGGRLTADYARFVGHLHKSPGHTDSHEPHLDVHHNRAPGHGLVSQRGLFALAKLLRTILSGQTQKVQILSGSSCARPAYLVSSYDAEIASEILARINHHLLSWRSTLPPYAQNNVVAACTYPKGNPGAVATATLFWRIDYSHIDIHLHAYTALSQISLTITYATSTLAPTLN